MTNIMLANLSTSMIYIPSNVRKGSIKHSIMFHITIKEDIYHNKNYSATVAILYLWVSSLSYLLKLKDLHLYFFIAMITITRMSTASRIIMIAPIKKPPISAALMWCDEAVGAMSILSVGFRAVAVCCGSALSGQSGSFKVSRRAVQSLSNCSLDEKTVIEAEPLTTHDWMREIKSVAL